jgi:8-oxo-dGTP pyrophosphatase MutT (NUDIX family)
MAASTSQTKTISSEKFVESCGAILFDLANLSDIKVCLVQHRHSGEWHFAKGRRNQEESRKDAAIREVMEETGFRCRLLPLTMPTRATPVHAHVDVPDKVHVYENLIEPFMCQIRTLKNGNGTKIIWWFIAALEGDAGKDKLPGEDQWLPTFKPWHDALNALTFQNDREMLQKALSLLQMTFPTLELAEKDASQPNALLGSLSTSNPNVATSKKAARRTAKDAKAVKRQRLREKQKEKQHQKDPVAGFRGTQADT